MNFSDLLKNARFVRSAYAVAAVALGLVFFFQPTIEKLALAGDSATLNLLLAFLFFLIVGVVGAAVFFGISKEEIDQSKAETEASKSKNKATLDGSKNFDGSQKGTGNELSAKDVEGGSFHQDSQTAAADPEKKTPPQN